MPRGARLAHEVHPAPPCALASGQISRMNLIAASRSWPPPSQLAVYSTRKRLVPPARRRQVRANRKSGQMLDTQPLPVVRHPSAA